MSNLAAAAKPRLEAALAELEARLTNISRDLSEPPNPDWDELAVEQEDDEALEHQAALIEREIASVRRALARIEDGTSANASAAAGTSLRPGSTRAPKRRCASTAPARRNEPKKRLSYSRPFVP